MLVLKKARVNVYLNLATRFISLEDSQSFLPCHLPDIFLVSHGSKVVSTHLWNTPRATFTLGAIKAGIPAIVGERGIARGVRYRDVARNFLGMVEVVEP